MKDGLKVALVLLLIVVIFIGLGWVGVANQWAITKVFAPKMEQVRRDTFVQSQAYNEGMAQQVEEFQVEYIQATPDQKTMLRAVILQRTAGYDTTKLPPADQAFLNQLRSSQEQMP